MGPEICKFNISTYFQFYRALNLSFFVHSAWIEERNLKPYVEFREEELKKTNMSRHLREAVDRIDEYISDPVVSKSGQTTKGVESLILCRIIISEISRKCRPGIRAQVFCKKSETHIANHKKKDGTFIYIIWNESIHFLTYFLF